MDKVNKHNKFCDYATNKTHYNYSNSVIIGGVKLIKLRILYFYCKHFSFR